jgi:hypothetical protein
MDQPLVNPGGTKLGNEFMEGERKRAGFQKEEKNHRRGKNWNGGIMGR